MDSLILKDCGFHHYFAPSSTKNKEKKRDPDAHQGEEGQHLALSAIKAHIGVDRDSGLVHTVEATPANVHDVTETSSC